MSHAISSERKLAKPVNTDNKKKLSRWWSSEFALFKKGLFLQVLLLPGLIYYLVFHYAPIYGLLIAFKDYNPRLGVWGSKWIGFRHFVRFFNIPEIGNIVYNTIALSFLHIVCLFPLAIILALFINELKSATYKKFVQTISYLPHFISVAAISGMITMFLASQGGAANHGGLINQILVNVFGLKEGIPFLDQAKWFKAIYSVSDVWQNIGWSAIVYIAALSGVDQELYEAATIDGATRVQKMWHISVQVIRPTIVVLLIMQIGKIMSLGSDKVLLLQRPSTLSTSEVISSYIYNQGMGQMQFDYSTAVGIFNSMINIIFVLSANAISNKLTDTGLW